MQNKIILYTNSHVEYSFPKWAGIIADSYQCLALIKVDPLNFIKFFNNFINFLN